MIDLQHNLPSNDLQSLIPSVLNLELTNACNLRCVFCDHQQLKKTMSIRELDDSLLEKILNDVHNTHIFELGLVGLGEPLLNQNFTHYLRIIDKYKGNFERISINTNGVTLDREKAEFICQSPINTITFSVNATNRRAYLELMGKDKYDTVVNNIKMFLRVRSRLRRYNISVNIQTFPTGLNQEGGLEAQLAEHMADNVFMFVRDVYNKPVLEKNPCDLEINFADERNKYPCWSLFSRVYIDVNGYLYPCTIGNDSYRETSSMTMGNVRDESVLDLFNSPQMANARIRAMNSYLPFVECLRCNVWSLLPNNFEWNEAEQKWCFKPDRRVRLKYYDQAFLSGSNSK